MSMLEKESLKLVDQQLKNITDDHLKILLPTSAEKIYGDEQKPACIINVRNYNFFPQLVLKGDIGLGESWLANEWNTEDLTGVFKILLKNQSLTMKEGLPFGIGGRLQYEFEHAFGRDESTDNPSQQMSYDLNDDFFQLYLDESTLMSSSALFESESDTLAEAQQRKIKKIIDLAEAHEKHHVLEVGCGRGALAIALAKTTGCRVTGTTVSEEEYRFARAKVEADGLSDLVNIELCPITEVSGIFDRIVSLESMDTIGRTNFDTFYAACNKLLISGGRLVQQVVTVPGESFEKHSRYPTWLHKNVFPGGMIPSLSELSKSITRSTDFTIETLNNIGNHYGETLRHWKKSFSSSRKELVKLGFDGSFQRKWFYFISYCEAAFETGLMNNHHIIITRPTEDAD